MKALILNLILLVSLPSYGKLHCTADDKDCLVTLTFSSVDQRECEYQMDTILQRLERDKRVIVKIGNCSLKVHKNMHSKKLLPTGQIIYFKY